MQNFGGTNKEYYGIFESGLLLLQLAASVAKTLNGSEAEGNQFPFVKKINAIEFSSRYFTIYWKILTQS